MYIYTACSLRKSVGPNNVRDPVTGFTCLHHAALNGHSECVKLILDYGAKPNAVDYKGSSALHLAAWAGNLEVVKILLGFGQASPTSYPTSSLLRRSESSAANQVESSPGYDTSGPSPEARSPASPINVDLCNNDNQTAVSLAAQFGHELVVSELLRHGANVLLRNNQLESPLDLACLHGHLATVRLLLDSSSTLVGQIQQAANMIERLNGHIGELFDRTSLPDRPSSVSVDGARESSPPLANEHQRRPSLGTWSSLLRNRGNRPEMATDSPASSNTRSPLQRLAAGTLSLRQKQVDPVRAAELAHHGRAGSALKTETPRPQMLDHSPLHLAIRRGHLDVADLLLRGYGANLLQVTNLGGCLHEVVLNNGKHSEAIGLVFEHIASSGPVRSHHLLERLLSLRDSQRRTVFDVIKEMNNRSAHEIRRLIFEFSEQVRRRRQQQQVESSQRHVTNANNGKGELPTTWSESSQHFSDINSFVTMKRAPRLQTASSNHNTQTMSRVQAPVKPQYPQLSNEPSLSSSQSVSNLTQVSQLQQQQQQQQQQQHQQMVHTLQRQRQSCYPDQLARLDQTKLTAEQQQRVNQLVRSQTDCSHLMSRYLATGDRHSAQPPANNCQPLDRRAINRHYHVYEHEFYPPRLLTNQPSSGQRPDGTASQLVPITPPSDFNPARVSSRLSLNMDAALRIHQIQQHQHQQPGNSQVGQPPMDRFLVRHSRSNAPARVLQNQADQRRSIGQQVPAGYDLDSHMSERQLFENTRKNLLDDFNQMIGRELLGCDSREPTVTKETPMQLTSVSLDMDQRGEHLTVMGTRIVAGLQPEQARQPVHRSPASTSSSSVASSTAPPKPPRPSLQRKLAQRSTGSGLTEPPSSKPPPPPQARLTSPLSVDPFNASSTSSGVSSSNSSEAPGLLKLADRGPTVRTPNSLALVSAAAVYTDAESDVCTSNSPASHDPEEQLSDKLPGDNESPARNRLHSSACMSPPSPNTAQLCIEQALIPLAQANEIQSLDQTTSPLICYLDHLETSSTSSAGAVDRWLQADQNASYETSLADYENCLGLQSQLKKHSVESTDDGGLQPIDDDADYAQSSSSPVSSVHSASSSSRAGTKEIVLRVLVDEEPSSSSDTFYINPNELKQISRATKRSQTDADTLTDEELSATIDHQSGLIRFTLRKRRGDQQPEEAALDQQQAYLTQPATSCELKRTKLNQTGSGRCDANNNPAEPEVQMQRFFQRKLPALMDYVQPLLTNGFHFSMLNHDAFLNDSLLSKVGIAQETHRQLIMRTVQSEMSQVDLDALLDKLDERAPVADLFDRLHLNRDESIVTLDAAKELVGKLTIGEAARLAAALEHLDGKLKQASAEINMDLDGGELEQITSSSSSRDSIKSIIVAPNFSQSSTGNLESKENQTPPELSNDSDQASLVKSGFNGSLVSETARRLEAAALANSSRQIQTDTPIAATRRLRSSHLDQSSPTSKLDDNEPDRRVTPTKTEAKVLAEWPPKSSQVEPARVRVAEIRSSLQRANSSSNETEQQITATNKPQVRPSKPAPPAKPAKLAIGAKLNLELASQRL